MAITREENDLLTRVENGAPMGEMFRQHYWLPAVPSRVLEAGGAPIRIRLLGKNYVVFRADNGKVACFDEQCPHRKASLVLAQNKDNSLRCIYHGWKFSVEGQLIEAANQVGDQERFCKNVRFNAYTVEERGGIVWLWLGKGSKPPHFPDLPFTYLPDSHRAVTSQEVPTNWLQAVEASMDSSHVGVLHESTGQISAGAGNQRVNMSKALAPRFEFEDRPYGYRYVALRDLPDQTTYARINNFVMPWYGIICAPEPNGPATVFFSTPVDDTTHRAWFVHYNLHRPLGMTNMSASPDIWHFPPLPPGDANNGWGQNRDLMKRGHATGFPQHLGTEDFAMFLSQGPIHDRTDEQLCSADAAIVKVRQLLLRAVREFQAGKTPYLADNPDLDYRDTNSVGGLIPASENWRSLDTGLPTSVQP